METVLEATEHTMPVCQRIYTIHTFVEWVMNNNTFSKPNSLGGSITYRKVSSY